MSRQSLHSLQHDDQCREDQDDTNNTSGINKEIKVNGQKLATVTSFKYLASVVSDVGSKPLEDSADDSSIDKVETSLE